MIQKSFVFVFCVLLCGCNSIKRQKLLQSGYTTTDSFYEEILFLYEARLPIVQAQVNGREGRFLFDTGAPNVLSTEFAQELGLRPKAKGDVSDSGGNTLSAQAFVEIEDIALGSVHFESTGAIIQDLQSSPALSCLDLDGLIGANLMRQAYWKMDYQSRKICISSDLERLGLTEGYSTMDFGESLQGTPRVRLELDGVKVSGLTYDTGSNGDICAPTRALEVMVQKYETDYTYSVGATSYGVGGIAQTDTAYFALVDSMYFGELLWEGKAMEFGRYGHNIGNTFLENFTVILDWEDHHIHLLPVRAFSPDTLSEIGFGIDWRDTGLHVGSIYEDSDAKGQLLRGDCLVSLEGEDLTRLSVEDLCTRFKSRYFALEGKDSVSVVVQRGVEQLEYVIYSKDLLTY